MKSILLIFILIINLQYLLSQVNIDSLDKALAGISDQEKLVNEYTEAAFSYIGTKDKTTEIKLMEKALSHLKLVRNDSLRLRTYYIAALHYNIASNNLKSFEYSYKSLNYALSMNDSAYLIRIYAHLARLFLINNEYQEAIKFQNRTAELSRETKDLSSEYQAINNIGNTLLTMELYPQALIYFNKADSVVKAGKLELDYNVVFMNKGAVYFSQKKYKKALEMFNEALNDINTNEKKKNSGYLTTLRNTYRVQILINFAEAYLKLKDKKKSVESIKQALEIAQDNKFNEPLASIYETYAKLSFELNDKSKIMGYLDKAISSALQFNDYYIIKEVYKTSYELSQKLGEDKKALNYLKKYNDMLDSMRLVSNHQIYSNLDLIINFNNINDENHKLKYEQKLEEAEKEKILRRTFYFIGLALILFILLLVLVFLFYKNRKMTKKILESESKLRDINITKDKFFSIIAHDLKSPISGCEMIIEMLSNQNANMSDEKIDRYLYLLGISLNKTSTYLESLLTWARSQSDIIQFSPVKSDFNQIALDTIELLQVNADAKNISLTYDSELNSNYMLDQNMIATVIRNLLSNAIKFTDDGGKISIVVRVDNLNIRVSVEDNGVGMTSDTLEKLFRIDTYVTSVGTSQEKGTGLGLILCKEFIEKHKGEILVKSKFGIGTTFTFTLPIVN